MIPSDRRPVVDEPLAGTEHEAAPARGTLPPPEWTSPGRQARPTVAPRPLDRRQGARAEEHAMRARVDEARAAGDPERLLDACATLARWLASRDRDLDQAVDLAAEALEAGEDTELRRELAAWLQSLGEPGRAAAVLRPIAALPNVDSAEAAYVLVRTGVLKARAGAAAGAATAFEAAAPIDPADALPAELLGAIADWAPEAVTPFQAAEAYVEAARRRAAAGSDEAQLEDLWRAFSGCPSSATAALALAAALERRDRDGAADEVLRLHARATPDPGDARTIQARRRQRALATHASTQVLGVALDEGADARVGGDGAEAYDALLLDLGLLEALAARLAARAARVGPEERASLLVELARLCAGPLADEGRAAAAYLAALAVFPECSEAKLALAARYGDAVPAASDVPYAPEDDGSDSRAAVAAAWVKASDGDRVAQASALQRVAATAAPGLRAVLLSCAAERWQAAGDRASARRCAELAVQTDPGSPRAVVTLAEVLVDGPGDRAGAAALERAISLVGHKATWCAALADTLDTMGETRLAVGWSLRTVALRPGDRTTIERLLDRLVRSKDGGQLGDTLAWLLSQPQPATWLGILLARSLRELATLDVGRGVILARRTLDVFGPRMTSLRDAMLEVATRAADVSFEAAVLERWIASGAEDATRTELLLRLADLRERLDDEEGEARVVAQAVHEGATALDVERHLDRLADRPLGPDAQLWRQHALAERLSLVGDTPAATWAWRDLGAALWDLAEDRVGAIEAWQRAARTASSRGHATLALDLIAFAGPAFAFEYLGRLIDTEPDDATAGIIAADVARAALSTGEARVAFEMAARGLARSPGCADALEVIERAAAWTGDHVALSELYDRVAVRALGRFGRRATHYRGARFFERRGEHSLTLKHAAQAFLAVPSEGSSFQLLARAAARAGDRAQAVRTLEQIAESTDSAARAGWLLRAASIAGEGEEGARRKVDVLIRATVASPNIATIALLRDAARDLLRFGPEEREAIEIRLARAARAITQRLGGPDGARVALAFATTFLDLFMDAESAFAALERAFASDADVDEFTELVGRATTLGLARAGQARVSAMLQTAEQPHANVGIAVLRLLAALGAAVGDESLRGRAAVLAAGRDPDDDALVVDADAAVRRAPELAERLLKQVPPARRAAALLGTARTYVTEGAHSEATPLFERALDLVEGDARADVERELHAAWEAAGRGNEIEARVQREAASGSVSPTMRADRWTQIAERREARGDSSGAVRALAEACKLDPAPMERWSALERVAEMAGDDEAQVAALEQIVDRVGDDGRVPVFRRMAHAYERRGDVDSATTTWNRVLALDPEDEEADHAIESLIVARGRFDELSDHLARRTERLALRSGAREILRAVRLRRAVILEQRLGKAQEACDELALLLSEWPDNTGALRYLADLLERQGQHDRAAPLWRRAAALESDSHERDELELRAGRASKAGGDLAAAMEHADRVLARWPSSLAALALRVEVARALGADVELGKSLEAIAAGTDLDGRTRADLLLEAAQAAARSGDPARALDRARRAAASAPERATAQLLARGLEYRLRGAGAPDEARQTMEELARIREPLGVDDEALRAFLLAEALDVVQGGGVGQHELEATVAVVGQHPLLALGMAERLAAQGQHAAAVDFYGVATSGPLLDLRRPGAVALAAAEAALRAGRRPDAARFLAMADEHEDSRDAALALRARMAEAAPVVQHYAGSATSGAADPVEPDARGSTLAALELALREATSPIDRGRARLALGMGRLRSGDTRGAEPLLWEALADGRMEAGDALVALLPSPERAHDRVRVRRQQVAIEPGDVGRLHALRDAALADDDPTYARAIEHVLRAFDPGAGPLPPPPLGSQREQPGMLALLARPSLDASGEALGLLWEGAMQLFVRDPASYGITGVERVVPGPSSAIARLYEVSMRMLDAPRIPLFVPRTSAGKPTSHVALLATPSVILTGDVREDTSELRFSLGRGMAGALSQNVLRLGLPAPEVRALTDAMLAAFGSPDAGRRLDARTARLAESFWQIVPARTQRRLQELLGTATRVEYEELLGRAHQSGRRVGLFLAGDFGCAARSLLAESGMRAGQDPTLGDLRRLCQQLPALADLLGLAVSPEYASARWQSIASAAPRGTLSSGRFSLF
jgi:tetratricopeptide (TPR) repeat protein